MRPEARVILAAAPTPETAAKLTRTRLRALLSHGRPPAQHRRARRPAAPGVHRRPTTSASPCRAGDGTASPALLWQLEAACTSADEPAAATAESFACHPDAEIITSFPGLSQL